MNTKVRNHISSKYGKDEPLECLILALIDEIEERMPDGFVGAQERYVAFYLPNRRNIISYFDLQRESIKIGISNKYLNYAKSLNFEIGDFPEWSPNLFGIYLTRQEDILKVIDLFSHIYREKTGIVPSYSPARTVKKPVLIEVDIEEDDSNQYLLVNNGNRRYTVTTGRYYRDSDQVKNIKEAEGNKCQICNEAIELPDGSQYSEGHHIKPLGCGGEDRDDNIIIVCPNCHVRLDKFAIPLKSFKSNHLISQEFIEYHNGNFRKKK